MRSKRMNKAEAQRVTVARAASVDSLSGVGAVLGILGCAAFLALSAQVRIPVPGSDVPMTLQLLAVLLTGFVLSPGRAAVACVLYVGCGAAGLPVFAPGSLGIMGPTGGYIVGFVVGAFLVSTLKGRPNASLVRLGLAGLAGAGTVLGMGVIWKSVWLGGSFGLAMLTGLWPFAPKALVEVGVAVAAVSSLRGRWIARGD